MDKYSQLAQQKLDTANAALAGELTFDERARWLESKRQAEAFLAAPIAEGDAGAAPSS
ncbi:MAG: hypothetical protein AB7E98_11995 [Pirellulales bacterium]